MRCFNFFLLSYFFYLFFGFFDLFIFCVTLSSVISSSCVETLLRPASAVPLKTSIHSISALAAVQKELEAAENVKQLTYELICTAHRSILTKGNESVKIGIKGLQMVNTAVTKYIEKDLQLEQFKNGTVLKAEFEKTSF